MVRSRALWWVPLLSVWSSAAAADRGALSVDVGAGASGLSLRAPYSHAESAVLSWSGSARLGARYAASHSIELTAGGFFEPPVTVFHRGVEVTEPCLAQPCGTGAAFPGTLKQRALRYGASVGARLVTGLVWRFSVGVEAGWSHRSNFGLQQFNEANLDLRLALPDYATDNLLLAPVLGLEWAGGDNWSLALLPRLEVLVGPEPTVALSIPLSFSWSWYL